MLGTTCVGPVSALIQQRVVFPVQLHGLHVFGTRVENTIDMAIEAEKRKCNLPILQHRQLDPVANFFGQTKSDSLPLHTPASRTFLATVSDHKS